jgi:hypothetical protein
MNTYKTWNNYVEVENIPVGKWVHVVILCKNNALEVFINGNLAKKLSFDGYAPYQNYQDIIAFSQRTLTFAGDDMTASNKICSLKGKTHRVIGTFTGMLSRLRYFNYALSYTEIASLMREGPNPKMADSSAEQPPYFVDTWWTTSYST